jgi:hypothetical protein
MAKAQASKPNLVTASQTIFQALEPLSLELRDRVLIAALSLLGMKMPAIDIARADPSEPTNAPRPNPTPQSPRQLSPVELIQQKNPSTNAQRIAVFAYHRDKVEGQSRFERGDLKKYFAKARLPPPQNYDRDFNASVKLGYVYEDGVESYLTSRGLEAVEAGFGGKQEPRGSSANKTVRKKKSGAKR